MSAAGTQNMNVVDMGGTIPEARDTQAEALRQAIVGCLWGTAVGDALGLSCEGLSKSRQRRLFPDPARYHFLFGRGMVSDDTEHTWMVAQALLVSVGDPERFGRSLAWQLRGWLLCLPAGVGFATLRATLRLWMGLPYTRSGVYSAGNGPAMRSALLGVCYGGDRQRLYDLVRVCTRITHTDPKAEAGALLIALAAHLAASGQAGASSRTDASAKAVSTSDTDSTYDTVYGIEDTKVRESLSPAMSSATGNGEDESARRTRVDACCEILLAGLPPDADPFTEIIEKVRVSAAGGRTTEDFAAGMGMGEGVSGYVCHTVPVALHAWLRFPNDYEQAVLSVIRCGGDADTTGAIVGALVGASAGRDGIKADWRAGLWEWPRTGARMEQLGARLADSLGDGKRRPPVRINPVAVLGRNTLFLIVILLHGFRRLLPPY